MADLTPRLRKLSLTAHVTASVGWLGAVAVFFALALAGLSSDDGQMVRATYLATELTTWFVIVPLAFASLLTGLLVSLGTQWGLFRHYWVFVKFMLTILATILLLLHTRPIGVLAEAARGATWASGSMRGLQVQLVGDAAAALLVLLVNVTLSVYKPRGLTAYGRRRQREQLSSDADPSSDSGDGSRLAPLWMKALAGLVVALLLFVVLHLTGRGLGSLHGH